MTVGKIYAGLIILENFRAYKQAAKNGGAVKQSNFFNLLMGVVRSKGSTKGSQKSKADDSKAGR